MLMQQEMNALEDRMKREQLTATRSHRGVLRRLCTARTMINPLKLERDMVRPFLRKNLFDIRFFLTC